MPNEVTLADPDFRDTALYRDVADALDGNDRMPRWSPDGRIPAFQRRNLER